MPRQGLGHSSVDIYNMVTPGTDDPVWRNKTSGQLMVGYQQTRSNFVLHSQDVTDTEAWTKQNTAIDSTLYEAPDNSTTANAVKSNGTGEQLYTVSQSISVTAGKTYTASVHLKKENLTFVQLRFADGDGLPRAVFNLTTGAVTNAVNVIAAQADAMDDDWYRCSITFVATTSSGSIKPFAQLADNDGTPNVAVSGIVLIYVWGFQLEENSEPSAYIVTTTGARTRTTTLNDTSETWDFDNADLMPEADPDDDGVWEVPANVVLNGDYEELGSELVTNGTFDADSNWTKGTGCDIGSGVFTSDGTSGNFDNILVGTTTETWDTSEYYEVTFDVPSYTSGNFKLNNSTHNITSAISASGSYKVYFKPSTANTVIGVQNAGTPFKGSVDNISVKQVDPNDRWTLGTGWSISDGKASFDASAASTFSYLTQASILSSPLDYELTFTLSDLGGSFAYNQAGIIRNGVVTSFNTFGISTPGTHTIIVTETSGSNFFFFGHPNSDDFSIDNVSVREYAIQPQDV